MSADELDRELDREKGEVRKGGGWMIVAGVVLLLLGCVGLYLSAATTLVSVLYFGFMVIMGGVFVLIDAFKAEGWKARVWEILLGLLYLLAGIMMIIHPGATALWFTFFIAAFLLVSGVVRIIMGLQLRRAVKGWFWTVLGGIASLLLALMIYAQWPVSGVWVIGMFVAIEMIMQGISMMTIGMAARVVAK